MTVDDRLREAHARIPEPDAATIARARERLTVALGEAPEPVRRRRRRLRGFLPVLPLAALAAAVAAVVVFMPQGDDDVPVPPATPATVTYERNTFQQSMRYITADGSPNGSPGNAAYAIARSVPEEIWRAPDGSGQITHGAASEPFLPSAADERAWRAAGSPDLKKLSPDGDRSQPETISYGPGELDAALLENANLAKVLPARNPLAAVPSEPRELAAWLNATAAKQYPNAPDRVIRIAVVADALALLRDARATSEQRLALIEVLSTLEGARKLESVRDAAGREWPGIALDRQAIAYNPRTGALMAQGDRLAGGVRWTRTYAVAGGGVAKVGERP